MAKKFEMTKEMEDALHKANVSEEKIADLRENGFEIQELSLDDLDAVSGGRYAACTDGWAPEDYKCSWAYGMTWPELAEFINMIYQQFGRDVTINFLNMYFFESPDWAAQFNPPGMNAYHCAQYMVSLGYNEKKQS